ncbi:hypothetical protein J6590_089637 [Homalodisca vitripennis]|nr:hypothetical protein J6590_089637 [Homalodisca vitripennis]
MPKTRVKENHSNSISTTFEFEGDELKITAVSGKSCEFRINLNKTVIEDMERALPEPQEEDQTCV